MKFIAGLSSKCDFCHLSSEPDSKSAALVIPDQSELCKSCHDVAEMAHHPIKSSPLEFNPKTINHNITMEGKRFYVSGDKDKLPIVGESRETAVSGMHNLPRPAWQIGNT